MAGQKVKSEVIRDVLVLRLVLTLVLVTNELHPEILHEVNELYLNVPPGRMFIVPRTGAV